MEEKKAGKDCFHEVSKDWMEATCTLWGNTFKLQDELTGSLPSMWKLYTDSLSKSDKSVNLSDSLNKFMISFYSDPSNLTIFSSTWEVLPLLVTSLSQNLIKFFTEVQNKLLSSFNRWNQEGAVLGFDDFRANIATLWKDMYESDFQKFFKIPQLGIGRNYQEQANSAMDTANKAMIAFSEFIGLLYIPVEKAGAVVMDELKKMMDNGQIPEDPKVIYTIWIKALEGHFMEMLQSSEYVNAMHSLIDTISDHKESKAKLVNAMLQQLGIPTNSEMDELYQELYTLKKRLKTVEKQLKSMEKDVGVSIPEGEIVKNKKNDSGVSIAENPAIKRKQAIKISSTAKSTKAKPAATAAKTAKVASPTRKTAHTTSKSTKVTKQKKTKV